MAKFRVGERARITRYGLDPAFAGKECTIERIEPDDGEQMYEVSIDRLLPPRHRHWLAHESLLSKILPSGSDIVREMIKNPILSPFHPPRSNR